MLILIYRVSLQAEKRVEEEIKKEEDEIRNLEQR